MAKWHRNKFKFKIKLNYKFKLQPIKHLVLTQYFKKSMQYQIKNYFIKKFKSIKKPKTAYDIKKHYKMGFYKRWYNKKKPKKRRIKKTKFKRLKLKKKARYFRKYITLKQKSFNIFYKPVKPQLKYNLIIFWKSIKLNAIKLAKPLSLHFIKTVKCKNYLIRPIIVIQKQQYSKKIAINKYGWFENKHLIKIKINRKRLGRLINKFRKIKKNNAFNTLFFRQFYTLTNLTYRNFKTQWINLRRNNNYYNGPNQLVSLFNIKLLLSLPNILFLLGYTKSINAGAVLIEGGSVMYNGKICKQYTFLNPGDIVQLNTTTTILKPFKSKLIFQLPFLYIDLSLMLIMVIRWPYFFEIYPASFASQRWIRYYIRQVAVKNKHINIRWKTYLI